MAEGARIRQADRESPKVPQKRGATQREESLMMPVIRYPRIPRKRHPRKREEGPSVCGLTKERYRRARQLFQKTRRQRRESTPVWRAVCRYRL